jgi:RNA recognition motif-containing protein
MTTLYIGNLPSSADDVTVRALFAEFGTVQSLSLINDRETGIPRGFGYVEMASGDAARAVLSLNGKDFAGHLLKVNESQNHARSGGGSSRRS